MTPRDIVGRALRLIKPKPEQEAACAAAIKERVELLRRVHHDLEAIPSPGDLKRELGDIGRNLRSIKQLLEPSTYAPALLWKTAFGDGDSADEGGLPKNLPAKAFLGELDRLIDAAEFLHGAIVVRPGSQPWDNIKAVTARYALELLNTFSAKKPTKTAAKDGGVLFGLAALLYKGGTGEDADLGRYCRDVLDHAGDGRIEPRIVMRVPFEG